jgi:L-alanine-DL-glutamate epimerase-like enolase superfamily enzyme
VTQTYPTVDNGYMSLPDGPGLGIELSDDIFRREDVVIRRVE